MYTSIEEIKAVNEATGQGWFGPGPNRFFGSRIGRTVYGGRYFVTSECGPSEVRRYSIRQALDDGRIKTVGEFQAYETRQDAIRAVRKLLETEPRRRCCGD